MDSLRVRNAVNLADLTAKNRGAPWATLHGWLQLEDGYLVHSPVGKFAANAFGLHDVHGNIHEWCLDAYQALYAGSPLEDPCIPSWASGIRAARGGGYDAPPSAARSTSRLGLDPEGPGTGSFGVRAARGISGEVLWE